MTRECPNCHAPISSDARDSEDSYQLGYDAGYEKGCDDERAHGESGGYKEILVEILRSMPYSLVDDEFGPLPGVVR